MQEFTRKRDYIMVGDVKMSPAELMISYMQAFDKEFELRDLQDKFPGVKDYVFYNHLYNETNNGLIWTSSKTFIYYKYLNISADTVDELRKLIDEQFESMKTVVISSRKIYAKMSLTNKELLEKLHLTHGQFTLFSLMKYLYPDLYYSRPLVSTKVMEQKSSYALIKNHAQKFDRFDHNTILDYVAKMNIGGLYSYLEFMDDMSDEYVQINIDTIKSKASSLEIDITNKKKKYSIIIINHSIESINKKERLSNYKREKINVLYFLLSLLLSLVRVAFPRL